MYIYRKRELCAKNGHLSYGYLMDMLWVSCGNGYYGKGKLKGNAPRGDGNEVQKRCVVPLGGGAEARGYKSPDQPWPRSQCSS